MLSWISTSTGISIEFDEAFAPRTLGFDPDGGAALVARLEILESSESALALREAEALRVLVDEGADLQRLGVVERPPQPLAAAVYDGKAVAVVNAGAEIARRGAALPGPCRNMLVSGAMPTCGMRLAGIERGVDVHDGRFARLDRRSGRHPSADGTVEQRMNDDARRRPASASRSRRSGRTGTPRRPAARC